MIFFIQPLMIDLALSLEQPVTEAISSSTAAVDVAGQTFWHRNPTVSTAAVLLQCFHSSRTSVCCALSAVMQFFLEV